LFFGFFPSFVGEEGEEGDEGGDEEEEEIDCVSKMEVKAVLTLTVGLGIGSSPSSVISLAVELAREMGSGWYSFLVKPNSSLADRAKSFSTLGVRKIRRFFLFNDPLLRDKGVD